MPPREGTSPVLGVLAASIGISFGLAVGLAVFHASPRTETLGLVAGAILVLPSLSLLLRDLSHAPADWRGVFDRCALPGRLALLAITTWPAWSAALSLVAWASTTIGSLVALIPAAAAVASILGWLALESWVEANPARPSRRGEASPLATAIEAELEGAAWRSSGGVERVSGRLGGLEVALLIDPERRVTVQVRAPGPLPPLDEVAGPLLPADPLVAALLRLGAKRVRARDALLEAELVLVAPGPSERLSLALRGRVLRALDRLSDLARRGGPAGPPLEPTRVGAAICPFCHAGLVEAPARPCAACGTPHHDECLAEGGGCAIMGCGWRPAGERARVEEGA